MRLNKFDLNLLLALDALLREKNVTRAAARLFVTQPAMSSSLAKLRESFNDPLLERLGRHMELTPRAKALRQPIRQILLDVQAALGASDKVFEPAVERRTFTVICSDYVSPWVMPGILRRLQHSAPGIQIEIERPTGSDLASVYQGDVDLLLTLDAAESSAYAVLPESIGSAVLAELPYVCLLSVDHPDIGAELTQEQFLRQQFVAVRQARRSSRVEEIVQERFGVALNVRAVTENVLELPFLVTTGSSFLGVTLEPLARVLKTSPRLKVLELPDGMIPASRLDMLWHRSLEGDAAHAWLRNLIQAECTLVQMAASPSARPAVAAG
jgi:LysR family nod box-dependent transcriptional activator